METKPKKEYVKHSTKDLSKKKKPKFIEIEITGKVKQ